MVRSLVRSLAALASILLGHLACVSVIAMTGGPDTPGLAIAFALLLFGFVGTAVARTASASWRPVRLCLAWASVMSAYLLAGLPFPPQGAERTSALTLLVLILGAIVAAVGVRRSPRVAAALLVAGAAWGALMCVRFATVLAPMAGSPPRPAIVFSYVLAGSVGAAWLAALWHGRSLVRPPAPDPALRVRDATLLP